MKNAALFRFFGAGSLMAVAACEPVDDGAATRAKGWDGGLTNNVLAKDRQVFIDTDETIAVADGCAKTVLDARHILDSQCAGCHDAASPTQDPTTFDFVTDVGKMKTSMWTPAGGQPMRYITAGQPEQSAIFLRAGIMRDMPPARADQVTLSGVSVLHYWIETCIM
jgi:hypothetical protein